MNRADVELKPHVAQAAGRGRALAEAAGLALSLAGLSFYLSRSYVLKAWSDPVQWFSFGQDFAARFGENNLAYLFPLLVAAATEVAGPVRAFLVNVPLLVVLALLFHAFGRQQLGGATSSALERWAPHAGAATVLLFVLVGSDPVWPWAIAMFRLLSSPYRDVLAHVLLLASLIALVVHRRSPVHALAPVAASAACLALATSTREASVLALVPMALYAIACRLASRDLPFLRPVAVFSVSFAIALVPYLLQNYLYSGNPLIPSQAADPASGGLKYSTVIPGVSFANLSETFPRTLSYLYVYYGTGVVGLMGLGLAVALRYRLDTALYLTLPCLILYLGFYGAYYAAVARYLFVVDLFALPLAGVGIAGGLHLLSSLASRRAQERIATASLLALFVLAAVVGLRQAHPTGLPFRIRDAAALHADVAKLLPERAQILGDRPLAEIFRSFVSGRTRVLEFMGPSLGSRKTSARVDKILQGGDPVYLVTPRETVRHHLRQSFDLSLLHTFSLADYGLDQLDQLLRFKTFSLHRLTPWTRTESVAELRSHRTGRHILSLDARRLSRTGAQATLYWNDRRLDPPPRDGWNCYDVMAESESEPASVRLVADRPVPERLSVRLFDPVKMSFPQGYLGMEPFISPCLRGESTLPAAGFQRVAIPAFLPNDAAYVVRAVMEIEARTPGSQGRLEVRAGRETLYQGDYQRKPKDAGPVFVSFPFVFTEAQVSAGTALVEIEATGPGGVHDDARIRSFEVRRHSLKEHLKVDVGREQDALFLRSGFYERQSEAIGRLPFRWMRDRASLWLLVAPSDRTRTLRVRYITGGRPPGVPPPAPRFRLNGRSLVAIEELRETVQVWVNRPTQGGRMRDVYIVVNRSFELPPELLPGPKNVLEIEATPWVPSESLPASENTRVLGLRLSRVWVK